MPRIKTTRHKLIDKNLGLRIKVRRKWLKMSQSDLADACRLTFQQIQKYERATNRVTVSRLYDIADALQTTPELLAGNLDGRQDEKPYIRIRATVTKKKR